jgi:hypothetical protein
VTVLAENVSSDLDEVFVNRRLEKDVEDLASSVLWGKELGV